MIDSQNGVSRTPSKVTTARATQTSTAIDALTGERASRPAPHGRTFHCQSPGAAHARHE
ncbi:MAG: hypothetical protein M5U09_11425 [Gammaproteobacteria bacterium]|nr:hypothetical protein [Gammaproteobacteria bacterium]